MRVIHTKVLLVALALGACARFEPTTELVVPLDERPPVTSSVTPPPITGGTLAVLDDDTAVAADPDRDRVMIVDLESRTAREVALSPGDEPGRAVSGGSGLAHVVLRGADAVVTIDTATGAVVRRRSTCREPRGIALDPLPNDLHVACASGQLITFGGDASTPTRTMDAGVDLRDVVLAPGGVLIVTRFKSTEVLRVPVTGDVVPLSAAAPARRLVGTPDGAREVHLAPAVAWRTVAAADGAVVMVHQRGQDEEVVLSEPTVSRPSSYGGVGDPTVSLASCTSIVETAVTMIDRDGRARTSGGIAGSVLPVDVAVDADGRIAIANAGARDPHMPRPLVLVRDEHGESELPLDAALPPATSVTLMTTRELTEDVGMVCSRPPQVFTVPEPVTAVAFTPSTGLLLAQTREPARLYLLDVRAGGVRDVIELGGEPRLDTGHELFHRDTGAGIACASCHPEGSEDGHVWRFSGLGPRRTQALDVGLAGTAPFHWDGELRDLGHLMEEVFVGRMGGVHQTDARLSALEGFLFGLESKAAIRDPSDPAVVAGRAVFERAGCGDCHSGASLTTNETVDVGTGGAFQVPSLVGIGYRAPFLHDGCAATLEQRFDPSCGGSAHGAASSSDAEVESLVAYLESL